LENPVAIVGLGALGSLFAGLLARAGIPVVGVCRSQLHRGAIEEHGLLLREGESESRHRFPVCVELPVDGKYALVIVLVKAFDTEVIAQSLAARIDGQTPVLTLQNGLGNAETLAKYLKPEQLLVGTTTFGALREAPGMVRMTGRGECEIGAWRPAAEKSLAAIKELFSRARIECRLTSNATLVIWKKLAVNAVINPLTGILRVRNGELLEHTALEPLFLSAAEEVWRVAARCQVALPTPPELVTEIRRVCQVTAANRSSMLRDLEGGSETEIDAINGAVSRWGRERGVLTPVNDALAGLVRALSAGRQRLPGSPGESS
jgi:2-dehydropantoate 2-reductase